MSVFPKPYADLVARLRVATRFCAGGGVRVVLARRISIVGIGPAGVAAGLLLRAWATGHLEKNIRLAESGPYAYVRNPLYLGTLLVAAGFVIASRRWLLAALFAAGVCADLPSGDRTGRTAFAQPVSEFRGLFEARSRAVADFSAAQIRRALPMGPVCAQPGISSAAGIPGGRSVPGRQGIFFSNRIDFFRPHIPRTLPCGRGSVYPSSHVRHRRLYREPESSPHHSGWPAPAGIPRV